MSQKATAQNASETLPETLSETPIEAPIETLPQAGGSYVRHPDGRLERVQANTTEE
jgi:hypothetical protein